MGNKNSDIASLSSELQAAQERILVLEGQLARQAELMQSLREHSSFREAVIEQASEGVCVCHDVPTHPFVDCVVKKTGRLQATGTPIPALTGVLRAKRYAAVAAAACWFGVSAALRGGTAVARTVFDHSACHDG